MFFKFLNVAGKSGTMQHKTTAVRKQLKVVHDKHLWLFCFNKAFSKYLSIGVQLTAKCKQKSNNITFRFVSCDCWVSPASSVFLSYWLARYSKSRMETHN